MSSPSPADSPPTDVTSPPPPPPTETTPTTPTLAPENTTQSTVSSPPPPTTTTVPSDSPPSPPAATTVPSDSPPPPPPATEFAGSSPATPLPRGNEGPSSGTVGIIVGVVIGGLSMLVVIGIFVCFYRRWKRRKMTSEQGVQSPPQHHPKNGNFGVSPMPILQNNPPPDNAHYAMSPALSVPISNYPYSSGPDRPAPAAPPSPRVVFGMSQSEFSYEELRIATKGFSRENILGQGGFGYVYKGVLPNGKVVAVKQLKPGSGQGEREFQAEVEVISRVHHRHLVSLVGYCISGAQRMLVYEFVPNGTLEYHLHANGKPPMKWAMRMKMALGSAKGLAYLHEDCQPKIIHRDIKAANILVDMEFEAKVADFGLAKFSLDTETHVSTRIMGTFGYLAPEYASTGKLTEKSDVFSFGVVLLELITGRYPIDKNNPSDESMVEWARPLLRQAMESGNLDDVVDPKLQNEYKDNEMKRMIACAAACVRHSARIRPRMSQIARALEGNLPLDELSEGVQPGHSSVYSQGSQDYNTREYRQDLEKFRKLALESQQQTTGEYSAPNTGSGLNTSVWSSTTSDAQQTSGEVELNYKNHIHDQKFR